MGHGDREVFFIRQGLQGLLPPFIAHPIAASPISRDQQFVRLGIEPFAARLPPPSDTLYRKLGRLMIDADIHEALLMHEIIDPRGDGFALS
jgi:hypothetical protein